jgi:hypothetical protein
MSDKSQQLKKFELQYSYVSVTGQDINETAAVIDINGESAKAFIVKLYEKVNIVGVKFSKITSHPGICLVNTDVIQNVSPDTVDILSKLQKDVESASNRLFRHHELNEVPMTDYAQGSAAAYDKVTNMIGGFIIRATS